VIAGIVGHADLRHGAAAGRALDALAEAGGGRFVGIRHATAWVADPEIPDHRTGPVEGLMGDGTWRAGFAELARRDLTYDAWLYHPQIPELTELARAHPGTTMVLDHLGGPLGVRSYRDRRDEVLEACRVSLAELAGCPNVHLKLGGIGMPIMGGRWHRRDRPATSEELAQAWGPHVRWCIDTFGPDRCMFESNFPVDRASCSYAVLWNAFKRVAEGYDAAERAELFAGTARRAYRLPPA
jgi:predicted TIM-barrel fold metal-dependent hydrolase